MCNFRSTSKKKYFFQKHNISLYTVHYILSSYTSILKHKHSRITALEKVPVELLQILSAFYSSIF